MTEIGSRLPTPGFFPDHPPASPRSVPNHSSIALEEPLPFSPFEGRAANFPQMPDSPQSAPPSSRSAPTSHLPVFGAGLVMFLGFAGLSSQQFYGYLFERLGFTPLQIGLLLGTGFLAGIAAPLAQITAIRRMGGARNPLLFMLAGAGLGIGLLPHASTFGASAILFFFALFCASSINMLNTACTLEITRSRGEWLYFVIRCVGTVGYLVGCVISFMQPDPDRLPWLFLGFGIAFLLAVPVAARNYRSPESARSPHAHLHASSATPPRRVDLRRTLRLLSAPRAARLLWTLGIMNFANAMATLVQGNYLVARFSGGQGSISMAWIVSTAFEIPLMLLCAWLVRRHGLRIVLGFGLLGTTIKLVFIGAADSYAMFLAGLAFHGCFFSGALTGFNLFLDRRYDHRDRPALQALGTLFHTGLPTALGGLAAGILWHYFGLRSVYAVAAAISVAAGVYTLFLMPMLPGRRE